MPYLYIVKKYVSILFLVVYMLSAHSEILELAKLPLLKEHFKEHKQWDASLSFIAFIGIHYFEDENPYGDQSRDMEMPFKKPCLSFVSSIAGFIVPSAHTVTTSKVVVKERVLKFIVDSSAYSSQYLAAIWQPPRNS